MFITSELYKQGAVTLNSPFYGCQRYNIVSKYNANVDIVASGSITTSLTKSVLSYSL